MSVKSVTPVFIVSVMLSVIAVFGGIIYYVTGSSYRMALELEQHAMEQAGTSARDALALYVQNFTGTINQLAKQRLVLEALTGDAATAQNRLKDVVRGDANIWSVIVFDDKGIIRAGINADMEDLTGGKRGDRDYFRAVMAGQDTFIGKSIITAKTGGGNMFIFVAVKAIRDAGGRVIGGVGIFPRWENFTATFVSGLHFGQRGYGFMLDGSGNIIAHPDRQMMLKDVTEHEFVRTALSMKNGSAFYDWKGERKYLTVTTEPVTGWLVCMSAYTDELAGTAVAQRNTLLGIGAAALLVLAGVVSLLVRRLVARPVADIEAFTRAVAGGNLHADLHQNFKYEFRSLGDNVRTMVGELKHKLGFAQGLLDGITLPCVVAGPDQRVLFVNRATLDYMQIDGDPKAFMGVPVGRIFHGDDNHPTVIGTCMHERNAQRGVQTELVGRKGARLHASVDAAPMYDLDGTLIAGFALISDQTDIKTQHARIEQQNERIAHAAVKADEVANMLASASEQLAAQIEQSSRGSDEQRGRTAEAAAAVEEMNAASISVARNAAETADLADSARSQAQEGARLVESVVNTINAINGQAETLKADMTELGRQADGIGQIMTVIADIADQTNLLALNAAIEAARAGDAGRGFAVVADEVRKLAEKTMTATSQVGDYIRSVQQSARANIQSTENTTAAIVDCTRTANLSGDSLRSIVGLVERTSDNVRAIAAASEQQSAASEQVGRGTEDINRIASETAEAMGQSSQAVTELARLAVELKSIIAEMRE
ncbi:methyl-accepting chemotaxis protein [Nitratidesulfovibrio liaohensis]|uniref:methyl-accepting chemotaxis protein n=1 Tax=Nitratidesulfovibrio liaohensis TaxID=2604158 RepID=UPI00141E5122|nr:methyl-accepting chemotaxis protein [Nitratidesulfovibrio liaohensis]NHZ47774.1 PAS domain-containing protein [Nitratidesulfovibrio liaohensis]